MTPLPSPASVSTPSAALHFGNARAVRTLWERVREAQAVRMAMTGGEPDRRAVLSIDASDILAAERGMAPGEAS